jgi:AraC-like DNA-binding protein
MAKTHTVSRDLGSSLKSVKGEALPYRQLFEQLGQSIPLAEALVVTSLPRGGLQIAQPQRLPEALVRAYAKEFHLLDRLTWRAIAQKRAVRARECWPAGELQQARFYQEFLRSNGYDYAAVVPLRAPVLEGYGGALHVYRTARQGAFSDAELEHLRDFAAELDEAITRTRAMRKTSCPRVQPFEDLAVRQFIFDQNLKMLFPREDEAVVDRRLRDNMVEYARFRLGHVNGKAVESDRVSLPDARGDLWHFRAVIHSSYPALGEGPFVFFCLQPACCDWSSLRPADFQADAEVARLVPAMKFMREHFRSGPTLGAIAKTVHLSPFHFHRRFTELFGITPKHFMLDCQIEQAKVELLAREKELADIATQCGFAHQSHFTSRFKQATGLTPTRWRRMAAEAERTSRN